MRIVQTHPFAVWLRNIDVQDWSRLVLLCFGPYHQIYDILIQRFRVMRSIAEGIILLLLRQFREIYLSLTLLLHSFRKSTVSTCVNDVNLHFESSLMRSIAKGSGMR